MSVSSCVALLALTVGRSPELRSLVPPGGQRGTEVTVELRGQRLEGSCELLFDEPGLECLRFESSEPKRAVAVVRVAEDCALGEHRLRLRTTGGLSELTTFWVGEFPDLEEVEPNDSRENAQLLTLPVTVHGVVRNEDVDLYCVQASAGQRIGVEIEGMRLGRGMLDATVSLLDERRFEIASCDDSTLLLQDPTFSALVPADGVYTLVVRHTSFGGGDDQHYRMHVGAFPRPAVVDPPAGVPGETTQFTFLGDPAGPIVRSVELPRSFTSIHPLVPERDGVSAPSPNWIRVHPLRGVEEVEVQSGEPEGAARWEGELPAAFQGKVGHAGDRDLFTFSAKAGQSLFLRLFARDLRSPLDGVLELRAAGKPKVLADNDDSGTRKDPRFEFTVPEDGDYEVMVRDQLGRGGEQFVYRLEISERGRSLRLSVPRFGQESQDRQTVSVPRGGGAALVFAVQRSGFQGDVDVQCESVPEGLLVPPVHVPAEFDRYPVWFEAAADAPLAGTFVQPRASCEEPKLRGGFGQNFELVLGPPNRTVFYSTSTSKLALAVVDGTPVSVAVEAPRVPWVRTGSGALHVTLGRPEGFEAAVVLRLLWTPPGVVAPPTVTVPEKVSSADYPLEIAADARLGEWPVFVQAEFDTGDGPMLLCAAPVTGRVEEPFVRLGLELAAFEQGQSGVLAAKLEKLRDFPGRGRAVLVGLPAKTHAEAVDFDASSERLEFPLTVEADAPTGKHQGLYCQIDVPVEGGVVAHQVGRGAVLRVDPPTAPPVAPAVVPTQAPDPAPPSASPERPLSRLEKLRLEAARRAAETSGTSGNGGGR